MSVTDVKDELETTEELSEKKSLTTSLSKKYKEENCKVIRYNPKEKTLDVNFKGYGIRICNIESFEGETVIVKYKGEIGKKDFTYKL